MLDRYGTVLEPLVWYRRYVSSEERARCSMRPGQSIRASSMCLRELTPCLHTGKSHQICKSTLMDTSSPRCGLHALSLGSVIVRGRSSLTHPPQYSRTCHATNTACRALCQLLCNTLPFRFGLILGLCDFWSRPFFN